MPQPVTTSGSHNSASMPPIKFGTDGWRGIIAADFTFERLAQVASAAAQVLGQTYQTSTQQRLIIVGFDRRFLAEEFAQATAKAASAAGFDVLLADTYAPTPALSWAVKQYEALGALVITASHNPGSYSGLKVKGAFGGSVPPQVTEKIEQHLTQKVDLPADTVAGKVSLFDPWAGYCQVLRSKVDIEQINQAIAQGKLNIWVDPMHGATAHGLGQVLGHEIAQSEQFHELHSDRDPLFGGGAPEPLPRYLGTLIEAIQASAVEAQNAVTVGLVFDGDGDRIAAMNGQGQFLSSQILIPILINHLAQRRGFGGEVIKTISGSDLIPRVAALHNLPVYETSIGYKYIADRMLETSNVLLGGEESGGIGYGNHIPERDGLLSALYLLEAIAASGQDLSQMYQTLQAQTSYPFVYDRIDLPLASSAVQLRLQEQLRTQTLTEINGLAVIDCLAQDGYKYRLADQSWLLIRFSGTEPVLRLYCEAQSPDQVAEMLQWAKNWASS